MPDGDRALADVLSELSALGTERDREQLAALRDRLAEVPQPGRVAWLVLAYRLPVNHGLKTRRHARVYGQAPRRRRCRTC